MNLEEIRNQPLDADTYYFVSPWGLGDTMIFCGLKRALEERLGAKVHYIVKPSHSLIMKMYGITDFTTAKVAHSYPHHSPMLLELAAQNHEPRKGSIYVAHPEFHPQYAKMVYEMQANLPHVRFVSWYKQFLGLPESTPFELPHWYPNVSDDLLARIREKVADFRLDNSVLLLPEATSVIGPSRIFWEYLIEDIRATGATILTNIGNVAATPPFREATNIDLSLEELVALSLACRDVYALRSGICDLIFKKGGGLHVFYPTSAIRSIFSLADMFMAEGVEERLLDYHRIHRLFGCSREVSFMEKVNQSECEIKYRAFGMPVLKCHKSRMVQ